MDSEERVVLEELKTVKQRVEYLLERYPYTRNDDRYLIILYIRHFCPKLSKYIKFIPYDVFKEEVPNFETITRARRKIQEEGRFLPTSPRVMRRRRRREKIIRRVIHHV